MSNPAPYRSVKVFMSFQALVEMLSAGKSPQMVSVALRKPEP